MFWKKPKKHASGFDQKKLEEAEAERQAALEEIRKARSALDQLLADTLRKQVERE